MLSTHTEQAIRQYWSTFLGCSPEHFDSSESLVVTHAGLGDYMGIWCFRRGRSLLVSVPTLLDTQRHALLDAITTSSDDAAAINTILWRNAIERTVGPAMLSYADDQTFQPVDGEARLLDADDAPAVVRLRAACPALDWEHGGGDDDDVRAGMFVGEQLVSLASYSVWGGIVAHISIVTAPQHRGQRFGHAAVSTLAAYALHCGLIPQYRTLESNTGSVIIARTLGFVPWATTVAVRLRVTD